MLIVLLVGCALGFTAPDSTRDDLARCAAIKADKPRLACYDALAKQSVDHAFSGKGSGVTEVFKIHGPRLLKFESTDVIMVVYLMRPDGSIVQNLHLGGQGFGEHQILEPGAYRIQVNASGSWRLWIMSARPRQDEDAARRSRAKSR